MKLNKLFLIIATLAVVILVFFPYKGKSPKIVKAPPAKPYTTPFNYMIEQISNAQIILNGQQGRMIIPYDENIVTIFRGLPPNDIKANLSIISVGQLVKLITIPGQSAKVYITQ